MSGNRNLRKAKLEKNDEFYTEYSDIEVEVQRYKSQFKNKVVFCNCDDPYESNFFLFFALNFKNFKLKKLISTCYSGSSIVGKQLSLFDDEEQPINSKHAYLYILDNEIDDLDGDGVVTYKDVEMYLKKHKPKKLKGDGDFRSEECIKYLKEADIVCTNPPFSLFREYMAQLIEYNKKFLIIGSDGAIGYKEIFPLLKDNKIWLGYNNPRPKKFRVIKETGTKNIVEENGVKYAKMGNCGWYTNLDTTKKHELFLKGIETKYKKEKYPKYYNYDAIDVEELTDIPKDYDGKMGVPITFLNVYNPDEFEIIGLGRDSEDVVVDRTIYPHNKKLNPNTRPSHIGYYLPNGMPKEPYSRIIIQKKKGK